MEKINQTTTIPLESTINHDSETTCINVSDAPLSKVLPKIDAPVYGYTPTDVLDFLARPVLYLSGDLATANVPGQKLQQIDLRAAALNSVMLPKLQGFTLMSCSVKIQIYISANSFQVGRCMLSLIPLASSDKMYSVYTSCRAALSMLPNLQFDIHDNFVEFEVPYVAAQEFFKIEPLSVNTFGTVILSVLAPLRTSGAGELTCGYSIYVSLSNVKLGGPAYVAQAGGKVSSNKLKRVRAANNEDMSKPVTTALGMSATIAESLSAVPWLAPLTVPTSWMLRGAEGLASYFGWSKRNNNAVAAPIARVYNVHGPNSDGGNPSPMMALSSTNETMISTNYSIRDEDECSFAFLKKVASITHSFTWDTSDIVEHELFLTPVGPGAFFETFTYAGPAVTATFDQGPPLYYLASQFGLMRGGYKICIQAVKNTFYSGKLELYWAPNTAANVSLQRSVYGQRVIWDISSQDYLEMELPYQMEQDYITPADSIGEIFIRVVTPLRAIETVSPTIDFLVTFVALDDFEFAAPTSVPWVHSFVAQSGICCVSDVAASNYNSSRCTGEAFTSVRQLLSRNTPFTPEYINANMSLNPWEYSLAGYGVSGQVRKPTDGDLFSGIRTMYAFMKGSVRVTALANAPAVVTAYADNGLVGTSLVLPGAYGGALFYPDGGVGIVETVIPYQSVTPVELVSYRPDATSTPYVTKMSLRSSAIFGLSRSITDDFQLSYFLGCPPVFRAA